MPAYPPQNYWDNMKIGDIIVAQGFGGTPEEFEAYKAAYNAEPLSPELEAEQEFFRQTFGDQFTDDMWRVYTPDAYNNFASVSAAEAAIQSMGEPVTADVMGQPQTTSQDISGMGVWQRGEGGNWSLVGGPKHQGTPASNVPAAPPPVTSSSTDTGASKTVGGKSVVVTPQAGRGGGRVSLLTGAGASTYEGASLLEGGKKAGEGWRPVNSRQQQLAKRRLSARR